MAPFAEELLEVTRSGFREIGYRDELLFENYRFADFLSPTYLVREIPLAGFAQQPPSYRTAGVGVLVATDAQERITDFRALGAPHLLVIDSHTKTVHQWMVPAAREPRLVKTIRPERLLETIRRHGEEWKPRSILRAKSISFYRWPEQLDFYDVGLFPVFEQQVHDKLDQLLGRTIATAEGSYRERYNRDLQDADYRHLFQLVFRLIAAKLHADRQHVGDWLTPDVQTAIEQVNRFYFGTTQPETGLLDVEIQQLVWDEIRSGFHLENLSLESLAYVYENTFVSRETRKRHDTHATPPQVAEFVVQQLPFEDIADPNQRTVFEPFAGHAPFLIAALGRLRTLLPLDVSITASHEYLVRMLTGIELDPFAREVAWHSLILADYPNRNGWRVEEDDVFTSKYFYPFLSRSNIVLCNPPFGKVTPTERIEYSDPNLTNKGVEAFTRVLDHPPQMLGFVLPRSFTDGRIYRRARKRLAETYANISITALPDIAFRFSEADTVVVLAHDRTGIERRWHRAFVSKRDYGQFWQTGRFTWEDSEHVAGPLGNDPPLWRHPLGKHLQEYLRNYISLGKVADIHRGVEYTEPVEEHISNHPKPGYTRGLHNVDEGFQPYRILECKYLDTNPSIMRTGAYLHPWNQTKVIANAACISRGPWRIIAAVDTTGLVCYQRFHGIWPKRDVPVEVITAVLNGPVANTLLSASGKTRDNHVRDLKSIPLPQLTNDEVTSLCELVRQYQTLAKRLSLSSKELLNLVIQIDVIVLAGYRLPSWIMGELLDYIGSTNRPKLDSCLVDQLGARHRLLVDKKFLVGLSKNEKIELDRIKKLLEDSTISYYAPIKAILASVPGIPPDHSSK